jgi:hypothetical protein
MQVDAEALLDRAQQVLVVLDAQLGVQAALHEDAGPAQLQSFPNFVKNDLLG